MWRQGQTQNPYTLSFLGTQGHGDSTLRYIPTEKRNDTPPLYTLISGDLGTPGHTPPLYTLISGDVGTRGVFSRIYTYGDRDRHNTPIHSHFWGRGGEYSLGYIDVETGTPTPPIYTLISGDVGTRGLFSMIYRCGDRDRHNTPIHSHFWGSGDMGRIL